MQHLTLGINTHINLDLGIAAAEACPEDKIHDLAEDFNKINNIIASLMQSVQDDLTQLWPPLQFFVRIANHKQEAVLNFSIDMARKASWNNALKLAAAQGKERDDHIECMEATVVILANRIINPGLAIDVLLWPVMEMESKKVNDIIDILYT